jgi:hypothetical protein
MKLFSKIMLGSALLVALMNPVYAAYDDEGTDYASLEAYTWVGKGPAAETLSMVDFLLCVMDKTKASDHPNTSYSAMVEETDCYGKASKNGPEFASITLKTKRLIATDPYTVDTWFVSPSGQKVVAQIEITAGPSATNPMGVFTINWEMIDSDSAAPTGARGTLAFTADNKIQYLENSYKGGQTSDHLEISYVYGNMSADLSTGQLAIKTPVWDNSINAYDSHDYRYVFNSDYLLWDDNTASAQCQSREVADMTKSVYEYKLFDALGAEKIITGPFAFDYLSSDETVYNGWAYQTGVWLENGEDDVNKGARPTTIIRHSDDMEFSICYDWDDDGLVGSAACGQAGDLTYVGLLEKVSGEALTFDKPLEFNAISLVDNLDSTGNTSSSITTTFAGSFSNLEQICNVAGNWVTRWNGTTDNCQVSAGMRPQYTIPDGQILTDSADNTTQYYVKASRIQKNLSTAAGANDCASLDLSNAPAVSPWGGFAKENIPSVDLLWSEIPTVSAANTLKYIHGVAQ